MGPQVLPAVANIASEEKTAYKFEWPDYRVSTTPAKDSATIPRIFGMILFPAYELMDVFGPLEPLQLLARQYQLNLALISETMDPVTSRAATPAMNPYNSNFFPEVLPTHTVDNAPDLDVLIIPGGIGTRSPLIEKTVEYIRKTMPKVKFLLTVCSGSLLAARAGVLDDKIATTNKASYKRVVERQPEAQWVPKARWTVDGNIWTTSGISSGVDGTLAFIECLFGKEVARGLTVSMEWNRVEDASEDPFAAVHGLV